MRDHASNIEIVPLFAPAAAVTNNAAQVSNIIPVAGFNALTLVSMMMTTAPNAATFTLIVEDGDDPALADHAPVDPALLIYTDLEDGSQTRKIGYIGYKSYVRVTITPANNTGPAFIAGVAVLGMPNNAPVPN